MQLAHSPEEGNETCMQLAHSPEEGSDTYMQFAHSPEEGSGSGGGELPTIMSNIMVVLTLWKLLRKIWGFHGGDYEECRLLGYKKPSSYFTGDTLRLHYIVQPVNAM
jgi:hypothetical protein